MNDPLITRTLYDWWFTHIDSVYALHGTSIVYEEYIRKNGLDPKKRPFSTRVTLFLRVVAKVDAWCKAHPETGVKGVITEYLSWNLKPLVPTLEKPRALAENTSWSLHRDVLTWDFAGGAKRGGEYLQGIIKTGEYMFECFVKHLGMQQAISEKEIQFIRDVVQWATKLRKKSTGVILRVKLSHPAFNFVQVYEGLIGGTFDNFSTFVQKVMTKLGQPFTRDSVVGFLTGHKANMYGFKTQERIKPEDIQFEYL